VEHWSWDRSAELVLEATRAPGDDAATGEAH
jgi:hypothetical protein